MAYRSPAKLRAECGITDEIELRQEGQRIIIERAKPSRAGWFDGDRPDEDMAAWEGLPPGADSGAWEW